MATQLVSFRVSGEFLEWLETQRQDGETLNLAAQRLLKGIAELPISEVSTNRRQSAKSVDSDAILQRLAALEERMGKLRA